jgi:hypothetical protein
MPYNPHLSSERLTWSNSCFLQPVALAFLICFLFPSCALTADQWTRLTDGFLQIDTSCNDNAARNTLKALEQTRRFLQIAGPGRVEGQAPLTVIAFRSQAEFAFYRAGSGVAGYYQRGLNRDYIVLRDLAPERARIAMHEYTHFAIERSGLHLPRWLNEGLADLYSSIQPYGTRTLLGGALSDRMLILKTRSWMNLPLLFDASDGSVYYRDPDQMLVAYSQGWLLAHMLVLAPQYASRFPDFLSAINQGGSAANCFESVYGKTVEQVAADLQSYFEGDLPVRSYPVNLTDINPEPVISPLPSSELELTLADLLAVNPDRQDRATAMLRDLASRYPAQPEPEAALGYIALRENRQQEARQHFLSALDRHSNDPQVLYYAARLQEASTAPPDQVIQLFERVLSIKPDYYEARLELGFFAAKTRKFGLAASVLADTQTLRPEHVYPVEYTLAYCSVQLNEIEQAKKFAQNARRSALNTKDIEQVNQLLRYIDQEQRLAAQ